MARFQQPPSSEDLLGGGVPTGDQEESEFIGVPEGFTQRRPISGRRQREFAEATGVGPEFRAGRGVVPTERVIEPTHRRGDENKPQNLPESQIRAIQIDLIKADLLSPKSVILGDWNDASRSAYKKVLSFGNRNGLTAAEALAVMLTTPSAEKELGLDEEEPDLPSALPSPEDVRREVEGSLLSLFGEADSHATESITNTFLAQARAKAEGDLAAQQEALNRGETFFTEAASPDIAQIAEQQFPERIAGTRIRNAAEEFFELVGV